MEVYSFTLPNGIRVVFSPDDSYIAHIGFFINAGSRDEKPHQHGLAHFIEHVIFKGTKKRRLNQIFSRIENVGGELNAYTTKEETCIQASFLKEYLNRSLELIADIVFNASFPDNEIEKEKTVIIDEINSVKDNPSDFIFDHFDQHIFQNSSLGRSVLGDPEIILKFSRNHILQFIQSNYTTDQMVISIVGNYSEKFVKKITEKHFGWVAASKRAHQRELTLVYQPFYLEFEKNLNQSHCIIGTRAYSYSHPRRIVLALINNMLGGPGMNARLNLELREKHGYTYNIESSYSAYYDAGVFSIYFGTDRKKLKKCIDIVNKELMRLRIKKLSTLQLSIAKKQLLGQLAISSENKENLMLAMGKSFLVFNKFEDLAEIREKLDKITTTEILEVANELFEPDKLSVLIYL